MGSFAKSLESLCARDVMTRQVVTLQADYTLRDAAMVLQAAMISGAPVVDEQGRIVGILSATDLVQFVKQAESKHRTRNGVEPGTARPAQTGEPTAGTAESQPLGSGNDWELLKAAGVEAEQLPTAQVQEYMSPRVVTVLESASLLDVARKMFDDKLHRLVVVDDKFAVEDKTVYLRRIIEALDH